MPIIIINLLEHSSMTITHNVVLCEISAGLPRECKRNKILPRIERYIPKGSLRFKI